MAEEKHSSSWENFWNNMDMWNKDGTADYDSFILELEADFPKFKEDPRLRKIVELIIDQGMTGTVSKEDWLALSGRFGTFKSFLKCIITELFDGNSIKPWFHGAITHEKAGALMKTYLQGGMYLVRYGSNQAFTIDYSKESKGKIRVHSKKIYRVAGGYSKIENGEQQTLTSILIDARFKNPIVSELCEKSGGNQTHVSIDKPI